MIALVNLESEKPIFNSVKLLLPPINILEQLIFPILKIALLSIESIPLLLVNKKDELIFWLIPLSITKLEFVDNIGVHKIYSFCGAFKL